MGFSEDVAKQNSIIEQKLDRSEITDSHSFFWDIVELSPESIAVHQDEKWIYLNNSALKLFKGEHSGDILGQSIFHFIHPAYHEIEKNRLLHLASGQLSPVYLEEKIICLDGQIIDVEVASSILSYKGQSAYQIILRDISVRKQEIYDLQSSENRYRLLFEYAPDAYYLCDLKGHILDGNRALEQITGYSRKDIIGKNLVRSNLLPNNEIPKAVDVLLRNSMGESTPPTRFHFITKNADVIPVEIRTYPIRIKSRAMVLGIARDIQERILAEKNLREGEEKFRRLAEAAFEGVVISDGGMIVEANQSFVNMLNYERQEIIGKEYLSLFPLNEQSKLELHNNSGFNSSLETFIITKDKSNLPVELLSKPILHRGRLIYITAIRDISERKRVQKLRENTEHILIHDIKNPLNAILGFIELLIKRGNFAEEDLKVINSIKENSLQITTMMRKTLDFLKMEEGLYTPNLEAINLAKLFEKLHKELSPLLDNKSLTITYHLNDTELNWDTHYDFHGEQIHIENLFANLLTNAIEASPEGNIITVSITDSTIQQSDGPKDAVKVSIHNMGAIPSDIRSRFFEQFVSSGKENGTGIGTFSAMLITRAHNGEISFSTSEGDGTQLIVLLPKLQDIST